MTAPSRSQWEAGDPTYDALAAAERRDHAWAQARGLRLRALTDAIVSALVARGILPGGQSADARVCVFSIAADHLEGTHALDIPELRAEEDA